MDPKLSGQNCKFLKSLLSHNSQKRLGYIETLICKLTVKLSPACSIEKSVPPFSYLHFLFSATVFRNTNLLETRASQVQNMWCTCMHVHVCDSLYIRIENCMGIVYTTYFELGKPVLEIEN